MQQLKGNQHEEMDHLNSKQEALCLSEDSKSSKQETSKFSSKIIDNEVLTLTFTPPYSEDHFGTKFQVKFDTYDQGF